MYSGNTGSPPVGWTPWTGTPPAQWAGYTGTPPPSGWNGYTNTPLPDYTVPTLATDAPSDPNSFFNSQFNGLISPLSGALSPTGNANPLTTFTSLFGGGRRR
jgi:hypothetical protein